MEGELTYALFQECAEIDCHACMKHKKEKTEEGKKLYPFSAELNAQKTFPQDNTKEDFHDRSRKTQQPAQARQNSCG